ncbi:hypothetical protein JAO76_16385 [Pontibacter sp. BT310]|uniref:Class I SAM-dependent methyltransferase n=1 Tax=Pontibacter populi TaxID=890055 RepID=A0ABS6XF88_9BACT|nr:MULTISPECIES: hypothetical protein [Pontibacter]MBJ6119787.1 hypothetical protein [Pontibacter sp. BT310]MBR0572216.1 hypothetical protein [Microvirga sp. STS03]MBW3366640.1 class I SAM-dependent methyltransferase [Pontibacter populi]
MKNSIDRLKELYSNSSKHSNYQILAEELNKFIDSNDISIKSRFEKERLVYILSNLHPKGKSILDIGGNTGYFTFELLSAGASYIQLYEGNNVHAEFVKEAASILNYNTKLNVCNNYYAFIDESNNRFFDITLLLNVLHHIGDDYGDQNISIDNAKKEIIRSINYLSDKTKFLIFQLGFCWKGNKLKPLFQHGTKKEMIDFIISGTSSNWDIEGIAVAEESNGKIIYQNLNPENISRKETLGEFLNRPLFILKSKNNGK